MQDYSQMLLEKLVRHINDLGRTGQAAELTEVLQVLEEIQVQAESIEPEYYISKGA